MSSFWSEEYIHKELEKRLQILLERLTWSYAALWKLNPQTRLFEWKRGHFNQALDVGSKEGTTSSWNAQLFYTTYKSCSFPPGTGAAGRANLEGEHLWLTGDAVCHNAASSEQLQFLRGAEIQTTMCIAWVDSVLEIGTTKHVTENFLLMDQIQQVLSNDLLEPNSFEHASTSSEPVASGAIFQSQLHQDSSHADYPTNLALQLPSRMERQSPSSDPQRSDFQSRYTLSDQVWRSSSRNLSGSLDMFMQDQSVFQENSHNIRSVKENLSFTLETGASKSSQMPTSSPAANWRSEMSFLDNPQPVNQAHGVMVSQADPYTSWSGPATSSSVSSQRDSSARSSVSPEELQQRIHPSSSPNSHFSAQDRASSSASDQLHSQRASPYTGPANGSRNLNPIRRTTSLNDQYDIQKALNHLEALEKQEQWQRQAQLQLDPASELAAKPDAMTPPGRSPSPAQYNDPTTLPGGQNSGMQFQGWQRDGTGSTDLTMQMQNSDRSNRPTVKRSSNASIMNQVSKVAGTLLRRQSLPGLEVLKEADSTYQKAETAEDNSNVPYDLKARQLGENPGLSPFQVNAPYLRGRRRSIGMELPSSSGQVHAGHEEAAVNHMLAERRRRVKEKENFIALRRLVPIISKADKASTLTDAIIYLKHLENQIQEMEASNEDIDQRCLSLDTKCKRLAERNQELVKIISKDMPSTEIDHLNHSRRLHSFKSI